MVFFVPDIVFFVPEMDLPLTNFACKKWFLNVFIFLFLGAEEK